MRTLKGWITTSVLIGAIAWATPAAQAGIIVGNITNTEECTTTIKTESWDLIKGALTAIIVGNLTGIIVGNVSQTQPTNCAIIVGN